MAYSIIETMPSIHSTLVGFVGAFLCAIGVYALQKLHEATDRLTAVLGKAKVDFSPSSYMSDSIGVVLPDGRLDWSRFSRVMHAVRSLVLNEDYHSAGYPLRVSSDDEIVSAFENLWVLLCHAFIMYPFNGGVDGIQLSEVAEKLKQEKFDFKRISEINERLMKLAWFKETSGEKVLEVARKYSLILRNRQKEFRQKMIIDQRPKFPPTMRQQDIDRMESDITNQPIYTIHAEQVMVEIFRMVDDYSKTFLPLLKDVLGVRDQWVRRLPIKKITKLGFVFSCFILLVGVFLPPLVTGLQQDFNLCVDFNLCWSPWMGYLLYSVSALPYFVGAGYLWLKFSASKDLD